MQLPPVASLCRTLQSAVWLRSVARQDLWLTAHQHYQAWSCLLFRFQSWSNPCKMQCARAELWWSYTLDLTGHLLPWWARCLRGVSATFLEVGDLALRHVRDCELGGGRGAVLETEEGLDCAAENTRKREKRMWTYGISIQTSDMSCVCSLWTLQHSSKTFTYRWVSSLVALCLYGLPSCCICLQSKFTLEWPRSCGLTAERWLTYQNMSQSNLMEYETLDLLEGLWKWAKLPI